MLNLFIPTFSSWAEDLWSSFSWFSAMNAVQQGLQRVINSSWDAGAEVLCWCREGPRRRGPAGEPLAQVVLEFF